MRRLAERLRDAGLRVWFDDWVIRPGDDVYLTTERGLYWVSQPVDVYLVIRQTEETGGETIRWMNVTRYLEKRKDKASREIVFEGERLDAPAVWRVRDGLIPARRGRVERR